MCICLRSNNTNGITQVVIWSLIIAIPIYSLNLWMFGSFFLYKSVETRRRSFLCLVCQTSLKHKKKSSFPSGCSLVFSSFSRRSFKRTSGWNFTTSAILKLFLSRHLWHLIGVLDGCSYVFSYELLLALTLRTSQCRKQGHWVECSSPQASTPKFLNEYSTSEKKTMDFNGVQMSSIVSLSVTV